MTPGHNDQAGAGWLALLALPAVYCIGHAWTTWAPAAITRLRAAQRSAAGLAPVRWAGSTTVGSGTVTHRPALSPP